MNLLLGLTLFFATVGAQADFPVTDVHHAITQDQGWLNTSRPLKPEDLKGRIILLDFWTFACINCIHVIPDLKELEEEYKDALTVIGIHSAKFNNEKDSENIRQAIIRNDLTHPVVNDASFLAWDSFHVQAWPTFVLVNPDGAIAATFSGEGQKDKIQKAIDGLLKKYGENINKSPLPIALEKTKAPPTTLKYPGKIIYVDNFAGSPALFISDSSQHRILGVRTNGEVILTVGKKGESGSADGSFLNARFNKPQGLLYDKNMLYVADTDNHLIRRIDLNYHKVETVAGTGLPGAARDVKKAPALKTSLNSPWDLAFFPTNKQIVIAMAGLHQLWTYELDTKTVSVLAGSGQESIIDGEYPVNALAQPSGLSPLGAKLYFVDSESSSLRVYENGKVRTLIGTGLFNFGFKDGKQGSALLQHPIGLAVRGDHIFVMDSYNHTLRRFNLRTNALETVAGTNTRGFKDGVFKDARFNEPNGITLGPNVAYITDTNNGQIRKVDFKAKTISTLMIDEPEMAKNKINVVENLPNLKKDGDTEIKVGVPVALKLKLDEGWHINELAPSYVALFEVHGSHAKAVKVFNHLELAGAVVSLPALKEDTKYRVQGTFYFCEIKDGAACMIQSHDLNLQGVTKPEATSEIQLVIKPEVLPKG